MNKTRRIQSTATVAVSGLLALTIAACGGGDDAVGSAGDDRLSGEIAIDGSSTVFPFAQAAAELFNEEQPDVRITVGQSGTGGGFEKFCAGETDISAASRPIKDDEEAPLCEENGVGYAELQVANDGIAVVSNPGLAVECLTTEQLERIWTKGSDVDSLADVDGALPDTELTLFGPGTDSGTFDFFTDEINGEEGVTRDDYEASEDDNQLVAGVAGSEGGMGYFGFSYYEANRERLDVVGVDAGKGCVEPTSQTIQDGSYAPLARPLLMYPGKEALARPEVKAFLDFALANHEEIAKAARIVPMTAEQAGRSVQALEELAGR